MHTFWLHYVLFWLSNNATIARKYYGLLILVVLNLFHDIDGLVQERRNSIANALELRLFRTNTSIYKTV